MAIHIPHFRLRAPRASAAAVVALCAAISCTSPADEPADAISDAWLNIDWSDYSKDTPTGLTAVFHNSKTGSMVRVIDNNTDHITAALTRGRHWATVFNLTPEEFDNIGFRGLETAETAEAYAREYSGREWLTLTYNDNSYVACQPEWLATDTILTTAVEPESPLKVIGTLRPRNVIHTLHIRVTVGNRGAMRGARAAISGLAAGRRLAANHPNDNSLTAIHLIESDSWIPTGETVLEACLHCFGLPSNHQGQPEDNILEFQALLSDGKTVKTYTLPVGHLIQTASDGGNGDDLDMYLDVHLDPVPPPADNSGNIDVWLKDWDESLDMNMPL